ncbi:MAG: transglycosylase SLT domain-containing protein [Gemmatimonadales bacterium]
MACSGTKLPPSQPKPVQRPDTVPAAPVAIDVPQAVLEDSAADVEALQTLRALEFHGHTKGAGHVRGRFAPPDARAYAVATPPRGGAASAGPTYDIDVESFADHGRVEYFKRFFQDEARDRFAIWLGRLNRYEGMIRSRFAAVGVPEDLVYIAMIESGYSNTAVSRANAVGMWQFMAATARHYGLAVDEWVDERRDPFRATDAAAQYLADHKERFGSWYLAAAAYNGGGGRVSRGLRRLSRQGDSVASDETFFRLSRRRYLRRETRDYVPKLIAATIIAKAPLRYGFDSIPYVQPLVFDEITVPDATGLDVLAKLADTTTRAMVELNPEYYRGVTPPGKNSIVRTPRGTGSAVAKRYAALPVGERVNFLSHKIRRGETLGLVGKRFGIGVRHLMAANPGIKPRRLRIGQRLVIPVSPAAKANPRSAPRVLRSGTARYHTVRWGESLSVIARRFGVRIGDLRRWNRMERGEILRAGSRLVVRP